VEHLSRGVRHRCDAWTFEYDGSISSRHRLSLAGRNITEADEGGSQIGRAIRTGAGGGPALTLTLGSHC